MFEEILKLYTELKKLLEEKKSIIIKNNLEEMSVCDEKIKTICETISKKDIVENAKNFTDNQKKELKELGNKIKELQKDNKILTNHAINVINGLLSGILNIIQPNNSTYNSKGNCNIDENISSITEEA